MTRETHTQEDVRPAIRGKPVRLDEDHWGVAVSVPSEDVAHDLVGQTATVEGRWKTWSAQLVTFLTWNAKRRIALYEAVRADRGIGLATFRQLAFLYHLADEHPFYAAEIGLDSPFDRSSATRLMSELLAELLDHALPDAPPTRNAPTAPASFRQTAYIYRLAEKCPELAIDFDIQPCMTMTAASDLIDLFKQARNGDTARPAKSYTEALMHAPEIPMPPLTPKSGL